MEVILCADEDVVRSFTRGCEVLPNADEGCDEDIFFDTCLTKCKSDFCNDGDGYPLSNFLPENNKVQGISNSFTLSETIDAEDVHKEDLDE